MHLDTRNIVISALLLAALAATWYFGRIGDVAPTASEPEISAPLGYYLKGAVLLGTNDEGHVFYRILAGQVSEGEQASLELDRVRVEFRDSENVSWEVTAARAAAAQDRSLLELSGGVRLSSAADTGPETVIETEHLSLEPDSYLASTSGEVAVSVGRHRLAATGMKAYLRDDRLELESKVHGQFRN